MPHTTKKESKFESHKVTPDRTAFKKPRPSREERAQRRKFGFLLEHTDLKLRTRAGSRLQRLLDAEDPAKAIREAHKEEKLRKTPPLFVGTDKIYSGKSRSFEAEFMRTFWDNQTRSGTPVLCADCGGAMDMNPKADDPRTIDHIKDWSTLKTELPDEIVCCNGHHWRVVRDDVMRTAFQDLGNLVPMHRSCNSRKNGSKTNDPICPIYVGTCSDGVGCTLNKATT